MVTEDNSCCRGLGWRVGMYRTNGAVDENNLGIGSFTERTNLLLVSLVGCDFNEVHEVTRYSTNHNFGD